MPTKKSSSKTAKPDTTKAVVSKLGVNDEPAPYEPKVVKTKNGRTITFNWQKFMTSSQVNVTETPPMSAEDLQTLAKNETDEKNKN